MAGSKGIYDGGTTKPAPESKQSTSKSNKLTSVIAGKKVAPGDNTQPQALGGFVANPKDA